MNLLLTKANTRGAAPVAAPSPYETAICNTVYAYYLSARGPRVMLPHGQLDPARLATALPQILVAELRGADELHVRLAGTAYRTWFGVDPTGQNWLDFSHANDREARSTRLRTIAHHPCGLRTSTWQFRDGLPRRKFEALTLPMAPRQPGGAPVILVAMADTTSSNGVDERDVIASHQLRRVDWSFVDLGAGTPDRGSS